MTGEVRTVGLNVEPARAALRSLRNDIDTVTKSVAALTVMFDEKTSNRLGRVLSRVDKQVKALNDTLVSIGTSGKMTGLSVLENQVTRLGYRVQDITNRLNAITIKETEREVKKGIMVTKGSESGSNLQRANLDMLDTIRDLTSQMRKSINKYQKLEGTTFTPFDTIREQKTRIQYVGALEATILRLSDTNREQTALAQEVREVRRRLKQMWRSAGTTATFAEDIKYLQEVVSAIENFREIGSSQTRLGQRHNRTTRERIASEAAAGTDPRVLTGAALGRTVLRALVQLENTARKIPSVGGIPVSASPSIVTEFALAVRNLGSVIAEIEKFPQLRVEHQGRAYGQASGTFSDMPYQTRFILSQLLQSLGGSAASLLNQPGMIQPLALRNVIVEPFSRAIETALERLGTKTKLTATERKVQRRLLRYNRPYTPQEQAYLEATGNIIGPVVPGVQAGGDVRPSRELIVRGQAFTRQMQSGFKENYVISSQRGMRVSDDYLPGDVAGMKMRAREIWDDLDEFDKRRSDVRQRYEQRAGKLDRIGPDYSGLPAPVLHEGGRRTLGERLTAWLSAAGPDATYALMLEQLQLTETPRGIAKALRDLTGKSGVYKFQQQGITLQQLAATPRISGKSPVVDLAKSFTGDERGSLDIDRIISGVQRLAASVGRFLLNEVGALGSPRDIAALSLPDIYSGTGQSHGLSNFTQEYAIMGLTSADVERGLSPEVLARGKALASGAPVPVRIESAAPGTFIYADWKFEKLRQELAANWNRSPAQLEENAARRQRVEAGLRAIEQPYTPQQVAEIKAAAEANLAAARAAGNPNVRSEAAMAFIAQTGQDPGRLGEIANKLQTRLQRLLDMEKVYAKQVQSQSLFGGNITAAQERLDRVRRLINQNQLYQDQTVRAQVMWDQPSKQKLLGYTPAPVDDPFAGPKPGSQTKIDPAVEAGKYQKAFTEGLGRLGALYDQLVATTTKRARATLQRQVDAATGGLRQSFKYWEMYDKQQATQAQQALNAFTGQQQARVPPLKPPRGGRTSAAKAAFAGAAYGAWQAAVAQAQATGQPIPPPPTMFGGSGGGGLGGPGGSGVFGGPPQGPGGFRGWLAGPNPLKEALFGNGEPQLWRGLLQYAGLHQLMGQLYKVQEAISGSVEKAAEFSIALAQIQTISEDAARQGMEPLSESIVEMSKKWAQPLSDTTLALYNVVSDQMGVMRNLPLTFGSQDNLDRALEFLDSSAEFSRAAVTPIQNAAEAIASVANSYQMGAGAASQIGAMLFRTIDVGRVTGQQLSGTIGRVMPLAAELGAQPQEILAGIAHQTIMGIKPEESYTLLTNVMLKLLRPTQALKQELADLGIESVQLGVQGKGLQGFLEEITARSGTAAESIGELFNQIRGTRGVLTLTGKDSENYKRILTQIESVTPEVLAEAAKRIQKVPGMTYREIKTQFDIFWTAELGPKTLAIFNAVAGLHPQTVGTLGTVAGVGLTGIIGLSAARQLAQMSYAGLEKTLAAKDWLLGLSATGIGASRTASSLAAMRQMMPGAAAGMTAATLNPYLIGATVAAVGLYMANQHITRPEYDETRYLRIEAERQPAREQRQTLLKIEAAKETKQLEAILKQAADNYFETFKLLGAAYQRDRKAVYDWADATTATMSRTLQSRVAIIQGIISQLQTMSEQAESVKLALTMEIADARNMASDAIFERSLRGMSPRGQGAAYFARAQQYMNAARRTDDEDSRRSMAQQAEQLALQGFDLTGNERALNDILNQRVSVLKQLYAQQEKIKQQAKRAAEEYEKGLFTFEKAYSRWQDLRTELLTEGTQKDSEAFKRLTVDMHEQAKIMQNTLDDLTKIDIPDKMGATLDRLKLRQLKGALEESFVDPVTGGMVKLEEAMASMIERLASKLREVFDSLAPELVESINKVAGGDALNPYGGFGGAARKLADQGQVLGTLAGQRADYRMNQELVRTLQEQLRTMRENLVGSWLQESVTSFSKANVMPQVAEDIYKKMYPYAEITKPRWGKTAEGLFNVPIDDLLLQAAQDKALRNRIEKQEGVRGGKLAWPFQDAMKPVLDKVAALEVFEKRLTDIIIKGDKAGPGTTKGSLEKALADLRKEFSREVPSWLSGTFTTQGRVNAAINKQLEQFSQQIAKTLLENLNLGVQAETQENLKPAIENFYNESARIRKAIEETLPPTTVKTVTESSLEVQQALENIIAPLRTLREEAEKFKIPAPVPTSPAPAPAPAPAPVIKPTTQQLVPQKQPVQEPLQDYYKLLSPTPAGGLQDKSLFREASYSPEREQLPVVPEPESFMVTFSDPAIQASAASISDMVENIKSAATAIPYSGGEVMPWYGGGGGGSHSYSLSRLPENYAGGGVMSWSYGDTGEASYDTSTSLYSLQQASDGAATSLTNMPETASYAMQAFQIAGSAAYTLTGAFESAAAQLASIRATPQGYASGGDVVPAMLTAGEFVTNPRASQTWYPVLRAMNNTSLPRYAEGGNVTNVGDVIVNINGSAGSKIDGREIAKSVRRALRQKIARLS